MQEPRPDGSRGQDGRQKLAALRARLEQEALTLGTRDGWARSLRAAALMPDQHFANILLIQARQPGATLVRDYDQWASAGRHVRRGEQGIEVFAIPSRPARQDKAKKQDHDQPEPRWQDAERVTHVWDLSQTTGPTLPAAAGPVPGQAPSELLDALRWLARRQGFATEEEHGAPVDGTTFWTARRIRLLPGLDDEHAAWALAHQLGHVLLGHGAGLPAGTTTTGCTGTRRAEAEAIAYVVAARHGLVPAAELASPGAWAGTDPRAQPAAIILAAGQRVTTAAGHITRHTSRILDGDPPPAVPPQRAAQPGATPDTRPPATAARGTLRPPEPAPGPDPATRDILQRAQGFYTARLAGSWAPRYLAGRGISAAAAGEWHIGYAPDGWTTLTDHLRSRGHSDDEIEAAGVAKRSSRGTLIDRFRDRIMLPVHDEHGEIAGFIGRARPGAPDGVPKYLNSPESAAYKKGSLLFGLHQGRRELARGAVPAVVEGPFDAIAVSISDPGRHTGLAPCGTALTTRQAELISHAANLPSTGILVAFDGDAAGRKAAARAYGILRPHTPKLRSARLTAKDPAEVFAQDGPAALRAILRDQHEPLTAVVIDARVAEWAGYLDGAEGRTRAMRSTAALIADLVPVETAARICQVTGGEDLVLFDDMLRPVDNPQLATVAAALPADTAFQVVRAAEALGFDVDEVVAEVSNAVNRSARSPKGHERLMRDQHSGPAPDGGACAPALAMDSFPSTTAVPRPVDAPTAPPPKTRQPAQHRPANRASSPLPGLLSRLR